MNKRILLFLALGVVALGILFAALYLQADGSRQLTFAECEQAGGVAWRVDFYDPEICPACAEYGACQEDNEGSPNLGDLCPQAVACAECMQENSPYPAVCPGGQTKLGEISDAATWFQCCR